MSATRTDLLAVIWDFDGTLADTRQKNLNVTREIYTRITSRHPDEVPGLASVEAYTALTRRTTNWRTLYMEEFGLTTEETDHAGRLWSGFQEADPTPVALYQGVREVITALADTPQGIVSQNGRRTITRTLAGEKLEGCFQTIIGYEEVPSEKQKPSPEGLLACIDVLTQRTRGHVLYIGDHETDARCGQNGNEVLLARGLGIHVRVIGAAYGAGDPADWVTPVAHTARHARDILGIVARYAEASAG